MLQWFCQWTAEQQLLHITGFVRVTYAILNASVILESNEKRLERNEKRLERNETCLARNETRGGNLLLIGTVIKKVSKKSLFQIKNNNHSLASPMSPLWPNMGLNGENMVISASFILILRSWRSMQTCQDTCNGLQFNLSHSCNDYFKYCTLYSPVWYIYLENSPKKARALIG